MDINLYLELEVETLGWHFSTGNQANIDLLQSDKEEGKVYFLLDPVVTNDIGESTYGGDNDQRHEIRFLIGVKSDINNTYWDQNGRPKEEGKYMKNIEPLKAELQKLKDQIDCSNYTRETWKTIPVVNQHDINLDGLIVTTNLIEHV